MSEIMTKINSRKLSSSKLVKIILNISCLSFKIFLSEKEQSEVNQGSKDGSKEIVKGNKLANSSKWSKFGSISNPIETSYSLVYCIWKMKFGAYCGYTYLQLFSRLFSKSLQYIQTSVLPRSCI